jgi:translation initiation factor 1
MQQLVKAKNFFQAIHQIKGIGPMTRDDSRLVYSTEKDNICPKCGRPLKKCICKRADSRSKGDRKSDGILRLKRELKGRRGKTVTTVSGFDEKAEVIKKLASNLKNLCGTGGSVKDGVILIQGDHRNAIKAELENLGFKVKMAGG